MHGFDVLESPFKVFERGQNNQTIRFTPFSRENKRRQGNMSNEMGSTRDLIQRSRSVADNADLLSIALLSGDEDQVEDAVHDLLDAYDSYTGQAKVYSGRFGFDGIAQLATPEERDQSAANALASALVDLEVAALLAQAAQLTGEIEGEVSAADLDETVATLNETLQAIEGPSGATPGTSRFAFDEVIAGRAPDIGPSPDAPTAKAAYEKQVKTVYDTLLAETTGLLVETFSQVSQLDADGISGGLAAVRGTVEGLPGGKAIPRLLEAVQRAIDTVKGIAGPKLFEQIEERINKTLEEIRKGEDVLQLFLKKNCYKSDESQQDISAWLKASQSDIAKIDGGAKSLAELQQQIVQTFTVNKKIVTNLRKLSGPIEWILKKFGGTLPLDLLMAGAFLLVIDVALLRGMDYVDTTKIVTFVDGTIIISMRALGVAEYSGRGSSLVEY